MKKYLAVSPLENGTVIDHIPAGRSLKLLGLLKLPDGEKIMLGINFTSYKLGAKDIIKVDNKIFNQEELNKIALIAPRVTINVIRKSKVARKYNLVLPKVLNGVLNCPNPKCVANLEPETLESKFYLVSEKPLIVQCHYCEREFREQEVIIK